jgi:hypothetical protein
VFVRTQLEKKHNALVVENENLRSQLRRQNDETEAQRKQIEEAQVAVFQRKLGCVRGRIAQRAGSLELFGLHQMFFVICALTSLYAPVGVPADLTSTNRAEDCRRRKCCSQNFPRRAKHVSGGGVRNMPEW